MMRNYGTHGGRPALGGMSNRPSASDGSKYALPANSILYPRASFEFSETGEPPLHELELRSGLLFFAVVLLPALFVGAVVVGYLAFIA